MASPMPKRLMVLPNVSAESAAFSIFRISPPFAKVIAFVPAASNAARSSVPRAHAFGHEQLFRRHVAHLPLLDAQWAGGCRNGATLAEAQIGWLPRFAAGGQ